MKQKDAYILLLEKARERLRNGETIKYNEFLEEVSGIKGIEHPGPLYTAIYGPVVGDRGMKMDAYFQLMEYEELEEARRDSKEARKEARIAIWVAVGLGVLQLVVSVVFWFMDKAIEIVKATLNG